MIKGQSNNNESKPTVDDEKNYELVKSDSLKNIFQFEYSSIGSTYFHLKKASSTLADTEASQDSNSENLIKTNVYCIRLHRLLKTNNKRVRSIVKKIFKLDRVRDLVHAICALYDNSLPDIGASSLYDCICAPKAYTICVVKQDSDDTSEIYDEINTDDDTSSTYGSDDCLEKLEDSIKQPDSVFSRLFSDDESETSEDDSKQEKEDEDEDEDEESDGNNFTNGIKSFLDSNKLTSSKETTESTSKKSWLLQNLLGCATLQRVSTFQLPGQDEWIIDLQLMSVRSKYRGISIGKYLLNLIQNKDYVGHFDAIVTSSDMDAIKFYEKYGFNVDPILNSKYHCIGDIWTNTTKMTFVPPYCQLIDKYKKKLRDSFLITKPFVQSIDEAYELQKSKNENSKLQEKSTRLLNSHEMSSLNNILGNDDSSYENSCIVELTTMENDFKKWQKLMFSAYQTQTQLFIRLKQEILTLKVKLSAKESIIDDLKIQNSLLVKKNNFLKLELNNYVEMEKLKLPSSSPDVENTSSCSLNRDSEQTSLDADTDKSLEKLIMELKSLSRCQNS